MIVYGWKKVKLKEQEAQHVKCPDCGSTDDLTFRKFVSYFHLFWVPFFPFRKRHEAYCKSCFRIWKYRDMDLVSKELYNRFEITAKTPLWTFTGLFVLTIAFGMVLFSDKSKPELEPNSSLSSQGEFQNGNRTGLWTIYSQDSNIVCQGNFTDGKKNGRFISYYPSGKILNEEHYEMGLKTGNWIYWNEEGDTVKTQIYLEGKLEKDSAWIKKSKGQ